MRVLEGAGGGGRKCQTSNVGRGVKSLGPGKSTILTSDSELILKTYMVTPTSTGGPETKVSTAQLLPVQERPANPLTRHIHVPSRALYRALYVFPLSGKMLGTTGECVRVRHVTRIMDAIFVRRQSYWDRVPGVSSWRVGSKWGEGIVRSWVFGRFCELLCWL